MVVKASRSFVSVSFSQNFVLRSASFGPNPFFFGDRVMWKKNIL